MTTAIALVIFGTVSVITAWIVLVLFARQLVDEITGVMRDALEPLTRTKDGTPPPGETE